MVQVHVHLFLLPWAGMSSSRLQHERYGWVLGDLHSTIHGYSRRWTHAASLIFPECFSWSVSATHCYLKLTLALSGGTASPGDCMFKAALTTPCACLLRLVNSPRTASGPELVTRAAGDVKDAIGRPVEAGQLAAVDPDCRSIALHLYDGQLKARSC